MDRTLKVLQNAGLEPVAVDKVVLVGGSTRIPKVWISVFKNSNDKGQLYSPPL